MKPIVINGELWRVIRLDPDDPALIDRTGYLRLATTDPNTRTIRVSRSVVPPLLDMVMLHEVAHAITVSYGLLAPLRRRLPEDLWILVEEWSAEFVENFGIEAAAVATEALGRPICIRGHCLG